LPRSGHTVTFVPSARKAFVFGGLDSQKVFNDLFEFDLEDNSWKEIKYEEQEMIKYPKARASHAASLDSDFENSRIFYFGGTGKDLG